MEIDTLKLNCFHSTKRNTCAFTKQFQWKLPSMFYAKTTSWRKFWFKMGKQWQNDTCKKNTQQMLKAKKIKNKNCKIRKTKNLSRWKRSKKTQNRCTMYQIFKMNSAFKENLWKHKEKMLQSWQICKITTKENFEWIISPKTPITMKKSWNK